MGHHRFQCWRPRSFLARCLQMPTLSLKETFPPQFTVVGSDIDVDLFVCLRLNREFVKFEYGTYSIPDCDLRKVYIL